MRCGGGVNHRMSLSDAALVKDNHVVAAGGVARGVRRRARDVARAAGRGRGRLPRPAGRRARRGRRPGPARQLRRRRRRAEAVARTAGRARLESCGGLTLDVARAYAETGVDYLAVGALTHSAPVLDIGLDLRASGASDAARRSTSATPTPSSACSTESGCIESWRIKTDARRTADEMVLTFARAARADEADGRPAIALCSTVPVGAARDAGDVRPLLRRRARA